MPPSNRAVRAAVAGSAAAMSAGSAAATVGLEAAVSTPEGSVAASRDRLRSVPRELAPWALVQQDSKAAALQAVSTTAVSTVASTMDEGSLSAASGVPAISTTTTIRTTSLTIPTMTMAGATSCVAACTPGTAGVFSRFRSAGDSADVDPQNASASGQLMLRIAQGAENRAASVYSAPRPLS
ncbi:hypothetical protein GALL_518180 [mine drainage metagenome]|uniref:Uncharacterized protein n=1 Tax=mine drainage metagenome TaxID=410659 RepID=A0A1J5P4X4_9ZZZZ